LVITASHNPSVDNGVKIVKSDAHLLSATEENIIEKFVNNFNLKEAIKNLEKDLKKILNLK